MKIAFITQPEYFRFMYENDLDFLGEVREFIFNCSMDDKDFAELERFSPDMAFFFRGEYIPDTTLRKLKGIKVNLSSEPFPNIINGTLNYTIDSLKRYKNFRRTIRKSFDYIFHYDQSSLPFIKKDGINLSGEFYFPVATSVYRKIHLPPKWDFFFIGRSTPHREKYFNHLKHHYNFLHICHGVWGEDLVNYANQSRILMNVHAEDELSWEPRMQMLMATGNMVISEEITKNPYLVPGEDYIEICTPRELIEKAEYYLKNDTEREKIAINGMKKIHEMFDTKKQFTILIENIKKGNYDKISVSASQSCLLSLTITAILRRLTVRTKDLIREIT